MLDYSFGINNDDKDISIFGVSVNGSRLFMLPFHRLLIWVDSYVYFDSDFQI